MDQAEVKRMVEEATAKAVADVLTRLGLDVTDPIEVQKDLAFTRQQRQAAEQVSGFVKNSLITLAFSGLATVIYLGIKSALK